MADVSERRIRPIQEAINGRHWKQALQLCEKWHKKGEKSDRFQVIRAYVLANQQDAASTKRGRDEIIQLCTRAPAVTDIDSIYQLQTALNDLQIEIDGGRKLWERAAAARPDDKDIAMTWLDEAIDRCDWQSAQKATMALRKISPKDRNYEFWTIIMCYMIYEDQSISEKERNLFGTLAFRMLSKAAEAVPQDPQQVLSAARAIHSPEELFLLVRVYLSTGHVEEAKGLLMDSKTLGPQSVICNLDHDIHRSLQMEVLEAAGDWSTVINELRKALKEDSIEDPQHSRMLRFLLDVVEGNDNNDLSHGLRECLENGIKILPNSRDLHDSMLRLLVTQRTKECCSAEELMNACKQYFAKWCVRQFCFGELQHPIAALDATLQQDLIDFTQNTSKANSESGDSSPIPILNALKLEYCILVSSQSTTTAQEFACKAVRLYRDACGQNMQSQESLAQMAMIASMAMLRVNGADQGSNSQAQLHIHYLQTGFLLRYCLTRCKDDYPTLVVLTLVSRLLGAMSLSAESFKSLSIKNLQWENVGHLLLTRLSTLHPHRSYSSQGGFDPLEMLNLALSTNSNSVQSVRRHLLPGLNHKSYINVMGTIKLREDLKRSFSKQLYCVERYRIKQLGDLRNSEREPLSSRPYADHRDFSFIPSFEHPSGGEFAQRLEAGPRPKEGWLRVMKICNAIADLMPTNYADHSSIKQDDVQALSTALDDIPKLLQTAHEFTDMEINTCQLQFHLGKALILCIQQDSPAATNSNVESHKSTFDSTIHHIQTWLTDTANQRTEHPFSPGVVFLDDETPVAPSWEYLHSAFSTLESLQLISLFLAAQTKPHSSSKSKSKTKSGVNPTPFTLPADQRSGMQDLISQIEKSIHDTAGTLKENLNTSGVLGRMIDMVFGRSGSEGGEPMGKELEQLPDAETVAEGFCGEVRESWEAGLDGILGVQVGVKKFE